MREGLDPSRFEEIRRRFISLREALGALPEETDRRIALDTLRDALDRSCDPYREAEIVADSFTIVRPLHQTANFVVLLVRQRDLGSLHALKTLVPQRSTDPLLRRLLLNEAKHQARVHHPACLPLSALLRMPDGRPAILTRHVAAPTLADVLRERRLDAAQTVALGIRLAGALDAVHAAGFVHGDLTPGNVFVPGNQPDAAIVFDFGLSRPVGEGVAAEDLELACSPAFAAPEAQATGEAPSPTADLFSLGRLLAVSCSFAGGKLAILLQRLQDRDPLNRGDSARSVAYDLACCDLEDTT